MEPDIGLDDPNNVYSCKPEEECCTKNLKPACCAAMPTDMMIQDQIELWVPLAVIITLLGLFVWFCRSDQSLLEGTNIFRDNPFTANWISHLSCAR